MVWVDIIIIAFVAIGLFEGFRRGLLTQIIQVAAIVLAFFVTLWSFRLVGDWMEHQLGVPVSFTRPISFASVFFITSFAFHAIGLIIQRLFAPILLLNPFNRLGGMIVAGFRQVIIVSIVLAVCATLPLSAKIKSSIDQSRLAAPLIRIALDLERSISQRFSDDTFKSLSYRIVGTEELTTTALNFEILDPQVDLADEIKLYVVTNEVRKQSGKPELKHDLKLQEVARAHGKDMLAKGYFSHISPQGKDALKRVQDAKINATAVGENLANAATVEAAQAGLMASEGHRNNILNAEFNAVGISVLDAGKHGKMIVEVFGKLY